jgi:trigger factor
VKVEEGAALTFKAEFDVVPDFDPGEFTDIEARRTPVVIDEAAVDQALERLRERSARFEPVENGLVGDGHTVVVDLARQGFDKEGKAGDKSKHERVPIEIGGSVNPPGLDDELKGLAAGTQKAFRLRFPDDYSVEELAGTEVAYDVKVHDVRTRVIPPLDDEFAKDMGEFETLDALRARVREDLEHEARHESERRVRAELMKQLAGRVPFEVPAALIDREVDRRLEDFAGRLMEQKIDPRQAGIDWNAFRDSQRDVAREAVAAALVLDEVARREQLDPTNEEVDVEVGRYAERTGRTPAAVRAALEKEGGLSRVYSGLRREKSIDFLMSRATISGA